MQINVPNINFHSSGLIFCGFLKNIEFIKIELKYKTSKIIVCQYESDLRNIRYP